jgi:hypothetical protein
MGELYCWLGEEGALRVGVVKAVVLVYRWLGVPNISCFDISREYCGKIVAI